MNNNRCYYCHEIIPEGRQVCWQCEHGAYDNLCKKSKKRGKMAIVGITIIIVVAAIITASGILIKLF